MDLEILVLTSLASLYHPIPTRSRSGLISNPDPDPGPHRCKIFDPERPLMLGLDLVLGLGFGSTRSHFAECHFAEFLSHFAEKFSKMVFSKMTRIQSMEKG